MSEDRYDIASWSIEEQARGFKRIAEEFYRHNFGRMGKADIEVLLFSIYLEYLLKNGLDYDDYTLAIQLGIPEPRVRTLKVKKELRYPYPEYDWKKAFAERIPHAKYDDKKALVKVSITDPNVRRDVEHYIDSRNWYSEYQLNVKLLQMRVDQFVELCMALYSEQPDDQRISAAGKQALERRLKDSRSSAWMDDDTRGLIEQIRAEGFRNCWQEVLQDGSKAAFKAVMASIPFGDSVQTLVEAFLGKL